MGACGNCPGLEIEGLMKPEKMIEPEQNKNPLLRPCEVARLLNVSQSEVSRLVKSRALPFYRLGTSARKRGGKEVIVEHVRFSKEDVFAYLKGIRVEVEKCQRN